MLKKRKPFNAKRRADSIKGFEASMKKEIADTAIANTKTQMRKVYPLFPNNIKDTC